MFVYTRADNHLFVSRYLITPRHEMNTSVSILFVNTLKRAFHI